MRSKWKGIFLHTIIYKFANTKFKNFGSSWLNQKINIRSSIFIKKLSLKSINIHNGISYVNIKPYSYNYIGLKIGQLTYNRLFPDHTIKRFTVKRSSIYNKILFQRNKIFFKQKRIKLKNLKINTK